MESNSLNRDNHLYKALCVSVKHNCGWNSEVSAKQDSLFCWFSHSTKNVLIKLSKFFFLLFFFLLYYYTSLIQHRWSIVMVMLIKCVSLYFNEKVNCQKHDTTFSLPWYLMLCHLQVAVFTFALHQHDKAGSITSQHMMYFYLHFCTFDTENLLMKEIITHFFFFKSYLCVVLLAWSHNDSGFCINGQHLLLFIHRHWNWTLSQHRFVHSSCLFL